MLVIGYVSGYVMFSKTEYHGPDSNRVKKTVYTFDDGKYMFIPVPTLV